jgi:MoCo/4Fe-4S cofactor protein with predicted Tat translocation signal
MELETTSLAQNKTQAKKYWQNLQEFYETPEFKQKIKNEFPSGAAELEIKSGVDRRNFLGILGSSMALAGVTSTGCIRKPREKVLPFSKRPEDIIEGKAQRYASGMYVGGEVLGLLVTTFDGRPTKVEGNPQHPMNLGATSAFAQAEILNMYDSDRSRIPLKGGKEKISLQTVEEILKEKISQYKASQGKGLAFIVEKCPSPSLHNSLSEIKKTLPAAQIFYHDQAFAENTAQALTALGVKNGFVHLNIDKAKVILTIDSNVLGIEGNSVANTKRFSQKRRISGAESSMNRLYSVESYFSKTGMAADHRLLLQPSLIPAFVVKLAIKINAKGVSLPLNLIEKISAMAREEVSDSWIDAVSDDLIENKGKSLVTVGYAQPAWVHAMVLAINQGLGNLGSTFVVKSNLSEPEFLGNLSALTSEINSGNISSVVMIGVNPVFNSSPAIGFKEALSKVFSIQLGFFADETALVSNLHIPMSHAFECWGDVQSSDGTLTVRQPQILPLFDSYSDLELLSFFFNAEKKSGYDVVKNHWEQKLDKSSFQKLWNKWLHDGVMQLQNFDFLEAQSFDFSAASALFANANNSVSNSGSFELVLPLSDQVFDGRYANNAWMQELPDAVTKLTWDNAALVSQKTAELLKVRNGDLIALTSPEGVSLNVPIWVTPGTATNTIVVPLGFGRSFQGSVCVGAGFNSYSLLTAKASNFQTVSVQKALGTYPLACAQEHGSMENRPLVREASLENYKQDPAFVDKLEMMPKSKQKILLWERPYSFSEGHQWGMTIDLTACTGCNACTVACNAENNISVVGKKRVADGREMHWIRMDRYFSGTVDNPEAVFQPLGCQHCENAPCEQVCPVGATVHSPEGTNDMAYNRCIGTRYCANNCPFKVRRFNYFAFAKENNEDNPLLAMQQNPNVTVRFRGVIEKCSYCIHRVNDAKIESKLKNNGVIADGTLKTACQEVCPADAIVFGDMNDSNSLVAKEKKQQRNYTLLGELALQPRTSYLAKIRNPNSRLV